MPDLVRCIVCGWKWDGKGKTCPECDFPIARFRGLLSGERVVYDEELEPEFRQLIAKHTAIYESRQKEQAAKASSTAGVEQTHQVQKGRQEKLVASTPSKVRKYHPLLAVREAIFYWVGYPLCFLATVVEGWLMPFFGLAIVLPFLLVIFALQPIAAAMVMIVIGGLVVWYLLDRESYWKAIVWGVVWLLGALAAVAGVLQWYALLLSGMLAVLLFIPGVVVSAWQDVLRLILAGDILLCLSYIWGSTLGISPAVAVTAGMLVLVAIFISIGTYRPFEVRRLQRSLAIFLAFAAVVLFLWRPVMVPVAIVAVTAGMLVLVAISIGARAYRPFEVLRIRRFFSTLLVFAAVALLLWQPVIAPVAKVVSSTVRSAVQVTVQAVSDSPFGRWYRSTFGGEKGVVDRHDEKRPVTKKGIKRE
jgi:hypothetical protein